MNKVYGFGVCVIAFALFLIGLYAGFYCCFVLSIADLIEMSKDRNAVDGLQVGIDLLCIVIALPIVRLCAVASFLIGTFGYDMANE